LDEVQHRREQPQRPWHRRAWDVIYTARADPRPAAAIAQQLGGSKEFVHQTIARDKRQGPDAFLGPGTGGRHHADRTLEQETAVLVPVVAQAATGDLPTRAQIQAALETQLGRPVADTTVYRLLDRHGWRTVVPRPQHPQSRPEARDPWKNTALTR
jgi:transposase